MNELDWLVFEQMINDHKKLDLFIQILVKRGLEIGYKLSDLTIDEKKLCARAIMESLDKRECN